MCRLHLEDRRRYTVRMSIGGREVDSADGQVIEVYNPYSGRLIDTVPSATRRDVESALEAAQRGKRVWAERPVYERAEMLLRYAELLARDRETLAATSSAESGKPLSQSIIEVDTMVRLFRGYVEKAKHFYGIAFAEGCEPGIEKDLLFTRNEPLGVIACIIPFNFPLELYAHKVAPALVTGNAVIIKPSSDTPMGAIRLTQLLHEAGVPGDVAQVLTGKGSTVGSWLASSESIDAVTFTGSTLVGTQLAREAAAHLHRVFLELGGNDPLIVFADADLDLAADEAVFGRTLNSGQVCCAAKRFIVQSAVAASFVEKLIERLAVLKPGDPFLPSTDMGPLVNEEAARTVERQIATTIDQGAIAVYGALARDGGFVGPVVLRNVTPAMDIAGDMEVFGPVFPIIEFGDLAEAIEIANGSVYGLSGGVMSNDINKCIKTASQLQCGTVVVNGSGAYRTLDMPFGGYKMSGLGREGISTTLEEMTQAKTIVMKGVLR
jgi:acyl-CoA reductase-like NAD-dependent aldehyde dehydrogenase